MLGPDLAIELEGDRLREDTPWERNNQNEMQSFDTLAGDALNRGAEDKPEEKLAPRAAAIVAGCNLKKETEERVDILFPTAATEPRASGRKLLVSSTTKRTMQAAWEVMVKARTQTLKLKTKIYEERKAPLAVARKLEDADPKRQDLLDEADRNQVRADRSPVLPICP